jgi:hypothetical protein
MASLPIIPAAWREQTSAAPATAEASPTPIRQVSSTGSLSQSPVLVESLPIPQEPSAIQNNTMPDVEAEEQERCWICQGDANEDEFPREWRRPCSCSLTAHNECLLEWVSSEEAPKHGELAGMCLAPSDFYQAILIFVGAKHKIVCPQCKDPIIIQRPFDPLVSLSENIQRAAKTFILPAALSAILGTVWSGFLVYGINTVHLVFGEEHAMRILINPRQITMAAAGGPFAVTQYFQGYKILLVNLPRMFTFYSVHKLHNFILLHQMLPHCFSSEC